MLPFKNFPYLFILATYLGFWERYFWASTVFPDTTPVLLPEEAFWSNEGRVVHCRHLNRGLQTRQQGHWMYSDDCCCSTPYQPPLANQSRSHRLVQEVPQETVVVECRLWLALSLSMPSSTLSLIAHQTPS